MMIVYTTNRFKEWLHFNYMIYDNAPYFVVKGKDDLSHTRNQNQASLIGNQYLNEWHSNTLGEKTYVKDKLYLA